MMVILLLTVVLLASAENFCHEGDCSDTCAAGTYKDEAGHCHPCPTDTFSNKPDQPSCTACSGCEPNEKVTTTCTKTSDTVCEKKCDGDKIYNAELDLCTGYTICPPGQGAFLTETSMHICLKCPDGTFNEGRTTQCQPQPVCTEPEKSVFGPNRPWLRTVCSGFDSYVFCPQLPLPLADRRYTLSIHGQEVCVQKCTQSSKCEMLDGDCEPITEGIFKVKHPRQQYTCTAKRVSPTPTISIDWGFSKLRTSQEWMGRMLPSFIYTYLTAADVMKLCKDLYSNNTLCSTTGVSLDSLVQWVNQATEGGLLSLPDIMRESGLGTAASILDDLIHYLQEVIKTTKPIDPRIPTVHPEGPLIKGCAEYTDDGTQITCTACHRGNLMVTRKIPSGGDVTKMCDICEENTFNDGLGHRGWSECQICTQCVGALTQFKDCTKQSNTYCQCKPENTRCDGLYCHRCVDI